MINRVIITSGSGGTGKDTFAKILDKHFSVYKYSSIDLVKDMTELCGIDRNNKEEKTRKLWSDIKKALVEYDDIPFNDVKSIVEDFDCNDIPTELLLIDIREPEEIEKAKINFDAITVLVKNDSVAHITSNDSDGSVFNYDYDYIVDNSGSLHELEMEVEKFVEWLRGDNEWK